MHMATGAGHRSLGWDDAGTIAVGNRADLVTISLTTERTAGASTDLLVEAAIFASTASDITSVVIDGRHVVRDGAHERVDVASELASSIEELFQ
jgi:cytosine/adenosine deaminase-related metal-dependent hydrolase